MAPVGAAALLSCKLVAAQSQPSERIPVWGEISVGSEAEDYLRVLQVAGKSRPQPWSIRSFGPVEIRRLAPTTSDHPWAARYDFVGDTLGLAASMVRPSVAAAFNSTFPYGDNDGAVWTGKGLTGTIQAGFALRYGALSAVIAPVFFAAQNADFPLMSTGAAGDSAYRDPRYPRDIDLPQRFGDGTYTAIDPGQSTLRLDALGVGVGISTANAQWGPAREYPIILGNNAAGFPHAFVGTSHPVNVWIGSVHTRLLWGALYQSAYSPMEQMHERRLMTGVVAAFLPRGLDGLELGVSRFFHSSWPEGGVSASTLLKPFESFLKANLTGADSRLENQLASVHARWNIAPAGFEIYGEFAREDHNYNLRDFLLEPDHDSAFLLGFQRVWVRGEDRKSVV